LHHFFAFERDALLQAWPSGWCFTRCILGAEWCLGARRGVSHGGAHVLRHSIFHSCVRGPQKSPESRPSILAESRPSILACSKETVKSCLSCPQGQATKEPGQGQARSFSSSKLRGTRDSCWTRNTNKKGSRWRAARRALANKPVLRLRRLLHPRTSLGSIPRSQAEREH